MDTSSMLELFKAEAEAHLQTLTDGLLKLEDDPSGTDELEGMMRAAHSIKGAARMVGIDAAVEVAHIMEDCFVAAQNGEIQFQEAHVDTLLKGVDTLTQVSSLDGTEHQAWFEENKAFIETLCAEIGAVLNNDVNQEHEEVSSSSDKNTKQTEHQSESQPTDNRNASDTSSQHSGLELSAAGIKKEFFKHFCTDTEQLLDKIESELNNPTSNKPLNSYNTTMGNSARMVGMTAISRLSEIIEATIPDDELASPSSEECGRIQQCLNIARENVSIDIADQEMWLKVNSSRIAALSGSDNNLAQEKDTKAPVIQHQSTNTTPVDENNVEASAPVTDIKRDEKTKSKKKASKSSKTTIKAVKTPVKSTDAKQEPEKERVLRVSADRLNRLMGLAGESLVESRWIRGYADTLLTFKKRQADLMSSLDVLQNAINGEQSVEQINILLSDSQHQANICRSMLADRLIDLEEYDRRSTTLADRLNREVIASRMRPFSDGTQGFKRMVRDVSKSLDKEVQLEVTGLNTQVDRDILEKIESPLNHIIRNSIDHGIELPAERESQKKPRKATIKLDAIHSLGMLSITISDDGRGVDTDKLKNTIVEKKMVTKEMAKNLSQSELLDFLFLPGFSTKNNVTEISGRGVGLDVVHSVIQEMRGQIRASSVPGKGMRIQLLLPLTLSVMRSLLVQISGQPYAFPLARIERILTVDKSTLKIMNDQQYLTLEDRHIGLVEASQVLELRNSSETSDCYSVIIVGDRTKEYGIVVEEFLGERDLAVHRLDGRLGKIKDISAGALMEDGTPLLIVDVDDLIRSIDVLVSGERLRQLNKQQQQASSSKKRILVVDDSITVREVERNLLESRGYEVDVAVDGMDGWNTVRNTDYDLVISDIDMPRMNGFEFVGMIKNDPNLKSIPVMIVSYKDREEDREKGLRVGADYYLTKGSFHDESLIDAVQDLIGGE